MTSEIIYEGNLRTKAKHLYSGNEIETDAPLDNQGMAQRFSPTDLVATALGSCLMTIMGIKARDMSIDLKGTKIEINKLMKSDPRRIGGVEVTIDFPKNLNIDEKQKVILERAAITCPVAKSLHPEIEQKIVFNW